MRYIALLRGINVGGKTMMKMDDLKAEFERLGFENVKSYINSGNIAFDSRKTAESKLAEVIESAIEQRFGRAFPVAVREQGDITRIIEANPFQDSFESHKEMHVLFLKEDLPDRKQQLLKELAGEGERYHVEGREVYVHLTQGVSNSLLSRGFFEKEPRVFTTARNWRTVQKLATL